MDQGLQTRRVMEGQRLTGPRRRVLDAIEAFPGPFTADELYRALPGIGRATVFRTMKRLQRTGVLCRVQLENGAIRYQVSTGEHHHHLICGRCGLVDEFGDGEVDELIERRAAKTGFRVKGHNLEIYGLCGTCQT